MNPLKSLGLAAMLCLSVSACATAREPTIRTVTVNVPVHAPCDIPEPTPPDYADDDADLKAAADLFDRVRLMAAGRLQRIAFEGELRAWGRACAS